MRASGPERHPAEGTRAICAALVSLAVVFAVSCSGGVSGASSSPANAVAPASASPSVLPTPGTRTVTYCTDGGQAIAMDVSIPANLRTPAPTVMYVHGGGWEAGSRTGGAFLQEVRTALLAKGFVVASIDYRLAPANKWPAQIIDTKCAIRYLRANAATYGIDPDRIGLWGGSAGGHLVSLAGTADATAGFDVGEWLGVSSRVQAVVDLFGPADLAASGWPANAAHIVGEVFGVTAGSRSDTLSQASPVSYIDAGDPPFLILHGDADQTVPLSQSQELAAKLQAAGVPVSLVVVKGGPHGLGNPREDPSPSVLTGMMVDFFTTTLGSH